MTEGGDVNASSYAYKAIFAKGEPKFTVFNGKDDLTANYDITLSEDSTLTINKRQATVKVEIEKVYDKTPYADSDATDVSIDTTLGGLLEGDTAHVWIKTENGEINARDEAYYFVLAFPNDSVDENRLLFEMARYNFSRYMVRNFDMSFEKLAEITLFEIKEFMNFDEAFLYRKRLYENGEMAKLLEGINSMIISKTNLELLLKHYSFGDYQEFYENNLLGIPEVEIDGYTLDEPDYSEINEE